jgi:hypothetical protein
MSMKYEILLRWDGLNPANLLSHGFDRYDSARALRGCIHHTHVTRGVAFLRGLETGK